MSAYRASHKKYSGLDLLTQAVEAGGYLPLAASNGRDALALLASSPVSAVILDLIMPEMSGFELIFRIREDHRFRDLPLFAITARELTAEDFALLGRNTRAVFLKGASWQNELLEALRGIAPPRL